jgi:hypothetical protein
MLVNENVKSKKKKMKKHVSYFRISIMPFVFDQLLLLATEIFFFFAGWVFFRMILFKNYEMKRRFVPVLFCFTFSCSLTLLELIVIEIVDVFERK